MSEISDSQNSVLNDIYQMLNSSDNASIELDQLIKDSGLSIRQISQLINVDRGLITKLIKREKTDLTFSNFLKIYAFLGHDPSNLIKIYATISSENLSPILEAQKLNFIITHFDVKTLYKSGFFTSIDSIDDLVDRIIEFFELDDIFSYSKTQIGRAFKKTKRSGSEKIRDFWLNMGIEQLKKLKNPNEFNEDSRSQLKELVQEMRFYSMDRKNGFRRFIQKLYLLGVTVIVQQYLTKTQIQGITIPVNNKPGIILTDLNKRYDELWLHLAHELRHVLFDFNKILQYGYHVSLNKSKEQVTMPLDTIDEDRAELFAERIFLSEEKYDYIKNFIRYDSMVVDLAKEYQVHPALIYGLYLRKNLNDYKFYINRIKSYSLNDAIKDVLLKKSWEEKNIEHSIAKPKELFHTREFK